jgi:hypothetical protein
MARWPKRLAHAALFVAVTLFFMGSGAFAYWAVTGGGSGHAQTRTPGAVTLSPATPTAALRPGSSSGVAVTITNSNSSAVRVGSLALDTSFGSGGFAVDGGHAGCATSALSYTTQSNSGTGWTVPARTGSVNGTLTVTLTNAVSMSTSAANACQGAAFTIYLTAGP